LAAPGEFGRGGDLERLAINVRAAVPAKHPADWNLGFVARSGSAGARTAARNSRTGSGWRCSGAWSNPA